MQMTSVSRWFRIVSIRIAVLPVERSPMISSRWPRPTFVIESIALIPVISGSFTGWRSTTPGALNSSGRCSLDSIGGPPSSGLPSGSTIRPTSASPTGMLATRPVRLTGSPSLTSSHSPKSAAPTLSSSRLKAMPVTPCSSASISVETAFSSPWMRAMPSPTWSTDPTSARSVCTSYCSIRSLRIDVISSGLSFTRLAPSASSQLSSQTLEAPTHAGVRAVRAGLQHKAADERRVDSAAGAQPAPRDVLDLAEELRRLVLRELDGGRQLDVEDPLLRRDERLELARDLVQLRRAALLRHEQEEVPDELVAVGEDRSKRIGLLRRVDLRAQEELAQLRDLVDRVEEGAQLVAHRVEAALLLRRLEERSRVGLLDDG